MFKASILAIAILLFLTAFGSKNLATRVDPLTTKKEINLSVPILNQRTTAELGNMMLMHEIGNLRTSLIKTVYTTDLHEATLITKTPRLSAGSEGQPAIGKNGEFAACFEDVICMYDKEGDGRFESATHSGSAVVADVDIGYEVREETKELLTGGYFKKAIIYQGISNNKMKFSYREFSDRTARPAFNQDFQIDLDNTEPTIFGFKGARIEVYSATNIEIEYTVTKYFQ